MANDNSDTRVIQNNVLRYSLFDSRIKQIENIKRRKTMNLWHEHDNCNTLILRCQQRTNFEFSNAVRSSDSSAEKKVHNEH